MKCCFEILSLSSSYILSKILNIKQAIFGNIGCPWLKAPGNLSSFQDEYRSGILISKPLPFLFSYIPPLSLHYGLLC